ncbi:hypothetical protein HTV45_11905 [Streptomyces sp. CHD11]|uniref:hypothetical protein n=1 Tax=Streptomyces sp. CHD11 TaxID=2741325 RepID=UPI001BFCABBC|nr:hypothetical protein [Streptomyces sp. CHD11]MBT3151579.1 hypothetical protein [Streptomyces sp. CHD11]
MEQRIGSSSQPLEGAGFDPAFIPGLTSPASGREEDAKARTDDSADGTAPAADAVDATEPGDSGASDASESADPADPADPAEAAEAAEAAEGERESDPEGPVFEASDRRARIVADHRGVRLRLDDQECEFRWDEIGAVETESARFGKRYTVTVHTPDRRWYPLEIEADSRSRFAEWDTGLDAVLDAYFDEEGDQTSEPDEASGPAESAESVESGESAENADGAEDSDADVEEKKKI